jgi:hypothetical protein
MILRYKTVLLSSILLLKLSGCGTDNKQQDPSILAKVGSEVLTDKQVLLELQYDGYPPADSLTLIKKIQSDWVRDQLLLQHADQIKISSLEAYQRELDQIKEELLLKFVTEEILKRNPKQFDVSIEEATEFYQQNRESLSLQESFVRIRPFTSTSRNDAESARGALLRGDEWSDIVSRYSVRREEQLEYERLFVPARQALIDVPALNRIIRNLGISEVSQIVSYNGAFHFVQLLEIKPAGETGDLDWALDQIQSWLKEEKKRKYLNSYIRNLYLQAESKKEIYIRDVSTL